MTSPRDKNTRYKKYKKKKRQMSQWNVCTDFKENILEWVVVVVVEL